MHCPTSEDVRAWTESALAYAKVRRTGRPGFSLTRRLRGTRADARKHHAHTQPAFHWGFIPLIIVLGMQTDPKPSLAQLLGPM